MPGSTYCLLFTRLVFGSFGICWNADAMPGNDGSCVNEDVPESKWSHVGGVQARRRLNICADSKVRVAAATSQ